MSKIIVECGDQHCRVILPERLDTLSTPEVQELIDQQDGSIRFLILDFSNCIYLSSNGIRLLVLNRKRMVAKQGFLMICALKSDLSNVLKMAGMLDLFNPDQDFLHTMQKVEQLQVRTESSRSWQSGNFRFHFLGQSEKAGAFLFEEPTLASLQELGFSFGIGIVDDTWESGVRQIFITTPGSISGISLDSHEVIDFQLPADTSAKALALDFAVSFPLHESGRLSFSGEGGLAPEILFRELDALQGQMGDGRAAAALVILKEKKQSGFLLSILIKLYPDFLLKDNVDALSWPVYNKWQGLSYHLEEWPALPAEPLHKQLEIILNYENIVSYEEYSATEISPDPEIFIFSAAKSHLNKPLRLQIESNPQLSKQAEFLVRKLYTDAASVLVEGLHGGYSAQTFQVTSFDQDKRRMRPTVMKIANKAIIAREADRCQLYALPYIFNNSAIVLGAQFLDELGALRYNFVGVGGENSRLKWLTHFYLEKDSESLIPVFDKVFQTILKPWYGQAVPAQIQPFKDHDPTFTFFPHIFSTASELFGISSDDPYFIFPETSEKMLNPYWFLKHEYARLRNYSMSYYSGICHGDLNMQNILLDENFNVYLIDFSETKPRSVISDFARLEAIFLIDNSPVSDDNELVKYVGFLKDWYASDHLQFDFSIDPEFFPDTRMEKNLKLSQRMRAYAVQSVNGETDMLAYYFALLEWILPIICYTVQLPQKKCALAASSILCSRIQSKLNLQYD